MAKGSLLEHLQTIPDPRRGQGRVYPLGSILGMLVVAALNGESSLRGMWKWAEAHWGRIGEALGFPRHRGVPQYGTLWNVLAKLPEEALMAAIARWAETEGVRVSLDGKTLRGSKRRAGLPAVQRIAAFGNAVGVLMGSRLVEGNDPIQAALELLGALPLEGRVVSLDAGLNHRRVVERVLEKGGPV